MCKSLKWICLAFTASIFCLLFSKQPLNNTITAAILLMPSIIGYLIASIGVGGTIFAIFERKANWEKDEFSLVYSFLPACILLTNFSSIFFLFQHPIWMANGGESEPLWLLSLGQYHFRCSLTVGGLSGFLLIFRALRKLENAKSKIAFTNKLMNVSTMSAILVIAITITGIIFYMRLFPDQQQIIFNADGLHREGWLKLGGIDLVKSHERYRLEETLMNLFFLLINNIIIFRKSVPVHGRNMSWLANILILILIGVFIYQLYLLGPKIRI